MSIPSGRAFAVRTAVGFGGTFLPLAVQLAFLPVWLERAGFGANEIGLVLGAGLAARIVLVPVLLAWSDRFTTRRRAFVAFAGATVLLSLPMLFDAQWAIGVAVIAASIGGAAIIPIVDAVALAGVQRHGLAYGRMRLWGSIAFIAATMVTGMGIDRLGISTVPLLVIGTLGISVACGLALPEASVRAQKSAQGLRRVSSDRLLLAGIACGGLVVSSQATFYAFASIHWNALDFGADTIAALWTVGVLAEIVIFAAVGKRLRLSSRMLLIGGAACGIVRWGSFPFGGTVTFYAINSVLHAGSFAAAYLGTQQLIAERVPAERHGVAQAATQLVAGPATAAMTVLSGILFARYGVHAFISASLLCALALVPIALVPQPQSARSGGDTIEPE